MKPGIVSGGKFEPNTNKKAIKRYDHSIACSKLDSTLLEATINTLPEFFGYTFSLE
jgi:hypothetical protein